MFRKQNIIFLGGRRPNETATSGSNPFKITRNSSSSASKTGFGYDKKSTLQCGYLQPKPTLQMPVVLGDRTNSLEDPGQQTPSHKDSATDSKLMGIENAGQKELQGRPQESIIERIEKQKKEFMEREKQREQQREQNWQQFHQQRHDQPNNVCRNHQTQLNAFQRHQPTDKLKPLPHFSHISENGGVAKKQYTRVARGAGLVGLNNIGNTCFMNSTLQCLFNIPDFSEYFLSGQYKATLKQDGRVAEEFGKLVVNVCGSNGKSESPSALKQALGARHKQFIGYSQQDAQQLLVSVLECIGEDLSRVDKKSAPYRQLTADLTRCSIREISNDWWQYNKLRDDSVITDFFAGQMMSQVICSRCKNESIAFDNFRDLSLSFPRNQSSCELITLLDGFFQQEVLSDDYFCTNCKKPRLSRRKMSVFRLPQVLVVQLKRFTYGRWKKEKIRAEVGFTEQLELKKYLHQESVHAQSSQYQLIGVVNHTGCIDFGHYTADCRNPTNGKWYSFNDSQVRQSPNYGHKSKYRSDQPYLLFYSRTSQ